MIVGITTIVRALKGHKSVRLDWSGLGFNLKVVANKSNDDARDARVQKLEVIE